jgi:hypothetical protein
VTAAYAVAVRSLIVLIAVLNEQVKILSGRLDLAVSARHGRDPRRPGAWQGRRRPDRYADGTGRRNRSRREAIP